MKKITTVSVLSICSLLLWSPITKAQTTTYTAPNTTDLSKATVKSTGAHTSISLANRFAGGEISIKDYCGDINLGNQLGDAACVQDAVSSVGKGKILEFYGNTVWPGQLSTSLTNDNNLTFVKFDGFVINPPGVTDPLSRSGVNNIVPNAVVFSTGSNWDSATPKYERYSTIDSSYIPMFQFRQMNDGPSSNQQGSEVVRITSISSEHSSGNMDGLRTYLRSSGLNYAGSFDVNTWSSTQSYGTNWVWDHITEMSNAVPYYCPSEASGHSNVCIEYDMNELDMDMLGPEKPESAYDPSKATRGIFGSGGGYSSYHRDVRSWFQKVRVNR